MMKKLLLANLLVFIFCCVSSNGRQVNKLSDDIIVFDTTDIANVKFTVDRRIATVFLDYEYAGEVTVFDSLGHIIKTVKNDFEEENFVMFHLLGKNDSMFHVIGYWSLRGDFLVEGWIYKKNHLGIFLASSRLGLILYDRPSSEGKVIITDEFSPEMYDVVDFKGKWLKIRTKIGERIYEGWMPREMQCSNVYSTCN